MQHIIRVLTKNDIQNAFDLRLNALQESPTSFLTTYAEELARGESFITRIIENGNDSSLMLGAFSDDNQLIGILGMHKNSSVRVKHKAYLWGTYVSPQYRNNGIATTLIENAISLAKNQMHCDIVCLSVVTDNIAAINLYQKIGFKTWGRETSALIIHEKSYDEYHMALAL